jgi:hypothetical protein
MSTDDTARPQDSAPVPDKTVPPPPAQSGPRVATVVWGLVLVALGAGVVAVAGGAHLDVGLAAIVVLAGAGVALLVGSLVAGLRRDRDRA